MKKKTGFTLAEILVSLGIIGVIAAVTMPTLTSNTQNAQIGPKLAKAVASFEQANKSLLTEKNVDSISEGDLIKQHSGYINMLSNHMNMVPFTYSATPTNTSMGNMITLVKSNAFRAKDGIVYFVSKGYSSSNMPDMTLPPHKRMVGAVYIDINGATKPNTGGEDIFGFTLWDDGSLRPAGGQQWNGSADDTTWETTCPIDGTPTVPISCTGHIFENNFKVLYK